MKFYNRERELAELHRLYAQAAGEGRMTVITGRRRVGKTALALEFAKGHRHLYLFVAKQPEPLLCRDFLDAIRQQFTVPVVGDVKTFRDIFRLLIELARNERFTVILDECQEFYHTNPAVYSEIQHLWDINKARCKMNLVCIGSVYSLMHKIFEESQEPLFGRADRNLFLHPFPLKTIRDVLADHGVAVKKGAKEMKALFDAYVLTGGMPKYLELLTTNSDLTFTGMLDFMVQADSPFIGEGKNLLIEEFGKEYGTYFSILELIAAGKTARTEIESLLEVDIGGYLDRLENSFGLVSKHKPVNAKPNSRTQKYRIRDNFLSFWFRFIYRNRSAIETGNYRYIRELIHRDYPAYCGVLLEKCFQELVAGTGDYNRIGNYWERGNENENDLVAVNDMKRKLLLADIKLNPAKLNLALLKSKATSLLQSYPGHHPQWLGLSLANLADYL